MYRLQIISDNHHRNQGGSEASLSLSAELFSTAGEDKAPENFADTAEGTVTRRYWLKPRFGIARNIKVTIIRYSL